MPETSARITESELEIMRVLWQTEGELPLAEIRKGLNNTAWEASTIKTLLRRLCDKGVVGVSRRDVFYYRPLIRQEEYNQFATRNLIDRLYRGSAKNLVASLLEHNQLSPSELEELRLILEGGRRDE